MKNLPALIEVDLLIKANNKLALSLIKRTKSSTFELKYGEWDGDNFYSFRNLFHYLTTNEINFCAFYNRFDAPNSNQGNPVAWGKRFLPDMMCDIIFSDLPIEKKIKEYIKLYKKCIILEKQFKRKNK